VTIDGTNPVVALCAAGMERDGTPDEARRLFEQAWEARQDDYDASIAAHFLARHQPTPEETLRWNAVAVRHAELVTDGRATELFASLYLNLADSLATTGETAAAIAASQTALERVELLPEGGYRDFVAMGIRRLRSRLGVELEPGRRTMDDTDSAPVHEA
jgi:hypothetical protein